MNIKFAALKFSALGLISVAVGATPNIPPPAQGQAILISEATLHTVSGAVIPNGRMLIEGGRITAIGAAAAVPDNASAKVIALPGKHVYPGLIAANTALGLVEVQSVRATVDTAETGAVNPNSRALIAVNADSELIPVARANGVLPRSPCRARGRLD